MVQENLLWQNIPMVYCSPKSGEVIVDGMNTRDEESIWEIRRRVGLVFQNLDNQIIATSSRRRCSFWSGEFRFTPEEIRSSGRSADSVGMTEYRNKEPHLLSGGQKQREWLLPGFWLCTRSI